MFAGLLAAVLSGCAGPSGDTRRGAPETGSPSGDDSAVSDTATDDTGDDTGEPPPPVVFNGCGAPDGVRAVGSWADPVVIPWLPFLDHADTTAAPDDQADVYDCASSLGEAGGEVVYQLDLPDGAWLRAEVLEAAGVDVDLHLLRDAELGADGAVSGCLDRANTTLEQTGLAGGTYLLVIDTYTEPDGTALPGAYTLGVEGGVYDQWWEVSVADGLSWRHLRSPSGAWGNQSIDVIEVDPSLRDIRPTRHDGGETVPDVASRRGALAAINGGFFDGSYNSMDFVRDDGVTYATNAVTSSQRTVVWDDAQPAEWIWLAAGADHTEHDNGLGSYPSIVDGGAVDITPDPGSSFSETAHPRTAVGLTAAGTWLLVTVDGRSDNGDGMSLATLGALMLDLGAVDAVNLDGGGSTTAVVPGCSVSGTVNHPSDGGGLDHFGARSVSDGVYIY